MKKFHQLLNPYFSASSLPRLYTSYLKRNSASLEVVVFQISDPARERRPLRAQTKAWQAYQRVKEGEEGKLKTHRGWFEEMYVWFERLMILKSRSSGLQIKIKIKHYVRISFVMMCPSTLAS
jgi:hypothetical protein